MIYLLAKYTMLFLLASILGFVLGYWWSRRNFVDVSESYEDLRKATDRTDAANWERLWNRLDSLPEPKETDLSSVLEHLDGVSSAVAGMPRPDNVDLTPVEAHLESLADRIANIPAPLPPKELDFGPLSARIDELKKEIHAIPAPAELGPMNQRLQDLEAAVRDIPQPTSQKDVDLGPIRHDLSLIRDQIKALPKVETHGPVDLAPVARQIDALEKRVSSIPPPEKVDLKPLDKRLRSLESEIGKLGSRLSRPATAGTTTKARKSARPKQRSGQPRILSAALYGEKDDLKRISGVGPKLERLLNKNGVYYFWQVASWSRDDIKSIDRRLDAFKGRISRDNWVSQARQLRQSADAATMPAD